MEENKKDVLPLEGEPLTTPQISEPVVNALAAALNKIETYVPTQYINDGPPDIDAEHLNHAEQAIMRVTNLANGAADAISALQSQVTQLNSDLGNTTKFLRTDNIDNAAKTLWPKIEESSSYDFTWIPNSGTGITSGAQARVIGFYSNNNYESQMVLTYLTSAPISQREKINGSWGKWKVFVTKSDLFSNVALVTDVHNIGKSCLFRAEYGSANTPTSDLGYIGISVCVGSNWKFVICSPYSGGKLFFDSVNTSGSWIGWKEIAFK